MSRLAVLSKGLAVAAIAACGIGVFVGRLVLEGERALSRSDVEFDQGHLREALWFARRAATLYAPGLPHVKRADARLDAIASGSEASQRNEIAILAWQAIRASEQQRGWGLRRTSDRAKRAELRLAVLVANQSQNASLVDQQRLARLMLSEAENAGRRESAKLGQIASALAVAVGLWLAYRGLGSGGSRKRWLLIGGGLAGLSAVAWAICLSLA